MAGDMHPGSLHKAPGSTRRGRYLGRGRASGHGKTSGRGIKGQFSRSGAKRRPGGAGVGTGGDIPPFMRIPKRGFYAPGKIHWREVNLYQIAEAFEAGVEVNPEAMMEKGLVSTLRPGVKVLGTGELTKAFKITAHAFSGSAKEKIEKAGGTCTLIGEAGKKS